MKSGLHQALCRLLPDADICVISERPWFSLTFSGTQLCLSATVACDGHGRLAANFASVLPTHVFTLRGMMVADIAVTEQMTDEQTSRLIIHALLLDD